MTVPSQLRSSLKEKMMKEREYCFVSCWHYASSESLAMWQLYGGGSDSVSIVTNTGRVIQACDEYCKNTNQIGMFGKVVYENQIVDGRMQVEAVGLPFGSAANIPPKTTLFYLMKAPAFSHEKEWRIIIYNRNSEEYGLQVPVDVPNFIDAIYLSPVAEDWKVEIVKELVHVQLGLPDVSVEKSPLSRHY